jgi:ribosomal protein L30E
MYCEDVNSLATAPIIAYRQTVYELQTVSGKHYKHVAVPSWSLP